MRILVLCLFTALVLPSSASAQTPATDWQPLFDGKTLSNWQSTKLGGTVIGLSSINTEDASQNETSQSMEFDLGRWYNVRIRVTPAKIEVWLDDRQIINQNLKGNRVTIRMEMEPSTPLGIATWKTKAALRDIRLRRL